MGLSCGYHADHATVWLSAAGCGCGRHADPVRHPHGALGNGRFTNNTGATHCLSLPDLRQLHFCVEIGSLSIDAGFSAGARAVAATKCSRGFGSDAAVPGISVAAGFTNTASRSLRPVRQLRHCFCFCFFGPVPTQFQALRHPTRAACCGLLGARAHCVRIGACNPTLCPIRGLQAPRT